MRLGRLGDYTNSLTYVPLTGQSGHWSTKTQEIVFEDQVAASMSNAIYACGSDLILISPETATTLFNKFPSSKRFDSTDGLHSVPCDVLPTLAIRIGDKDFPLPHVNLGQSPEAGSGQCIVGIADWDSSFGPDTVVLAECSLKAIMWSLTNLATGSVLRPWSDFHSY